MPPATLATTRFSELASTFEKLRVGEGAVKEMAQYLLELAFRDLQHFAAGGIIVPQLGNDAGSEQEFASSASSPHNDDNLKNQLDVALKLLWINPTAKNDGDTQTLAFSGGKCLLFWPINYGFDRPIGFFYALVNKTDSQGGLHRLQYISKHVATSMRAEKACHALDQLAAAIFVSSVTTDDVAQKVAHAALSALSCSGIVIWRLQQKSLLHNIAAVGSAEGSALDMRTNQGIAGRCAETYKNLIIDDLLDSAELAGKGITKIHHDKIVADKKWRSAIFVPLDIGGQAAGVFAAYGLRPRGFSTIDLKIALAFAQRLSAGYAHTQRIQHLQTMEAKISMEADAIEAGLLALENVHDAINDLGAAQNELNLIKAEFGDQLNTKVIDRIRACAVQLSSGKEKIQALASRAKFRQFLLRPTSIRELLDSRVARIRNLADASKIYVNVICPRDLTLSVDRDKMGRVFLNFLYNSIYFVKLKAQEKQIEIKVEHRPENKCVSLRFWDNGVGIDSNNLPQVFDYFFTTKGDRGLGFGLAIAKRLVEEGHGGTVKVKSQWGYWTEFEVQLPDSLIVK